MAEKLKKGRKTKRWKAKKTHVYSEFKRELRLETAAMISGKKMKDRDEMGGNGIDLLNLLRRIVLNYY